MAPAFRMHRLGAALCEFDDGESSVTERETCLPVDPNGSGVRATPVERRRHGLYSPMRVVRARGRQDSRYAAHLGLSDADVASCEDPSPIPLSTGRNISAGIPLQSDLRRSLMFSLAPCLRAVVRVRTICGSAPYRLAQSRKHIRLHH